jgi:hypothetical protein
VLDENNCLIGVTYKLFTDDVAPPLVLLRIQKILETNKRATIQFRPAESRVNRFAKAGYRKRVYLKKIRSVKFLKEKSDRGFLIFLLERKGDDAILRY